MDIVVVTNGTDKKIKGRYAGKDYLFPVNEDVSVLISVAQHIFGFKTPDKTMALTRLGWMKSSEDYDTALEQLSLVKFGVINDAKTSSNVGPLVNAGGAAEEGAPLVPSSKATRLKQGAEQII